MTERDAGKPSREPEGGQSPSWTVRAAGSAFFILALAVAALTVRFFTRTERAPAEAAPQHDHMAMSGAASPEARPVMLSPEDARRIGVTFAVASLETVPRDVRAAGELVVDETRVRTIASRVDGWVERLHADFVGRDVRAGDPLLEIYAPALVAAQEELLLARRLATRVDSGVAASTSGVADLVEAARARLRAWDVPESVIHDVEVTGQAKRTLTIRAPASGVVVDKQVLAGQSIAAGQNLLRVADLSTVWLEADVFEQDLNAVRIGMPVVVDIRALPGEERTGHVTFIAPTLDAATRTARLRIELSNRKRDLKPGMFASIRFGAPSRGDIISVPRSAVLSTGERSIVFVKRSDGMLEPRVVVIGGSNDERTQVLRGLAVGETVVASATFLVDAESNLGTALGGMGDMPGMDLTKPAPAPASPPALAPETPKKRSSSGAAEHPPRGRE
ncbi:MAG: efflux RND transporter periplasmic adaptor subunit [Gemmatimonadaceae bacterium]